MGYLADSISLYLPTLLIKTWLALESSLVNHNALWKITQALLENRTRLPCCSPYPCLYTEVRLVDQDPQYPGAHRSPVYIFHGSHFCQRRETEERRHGRHLRSAAPRLRGLGVVGAFVMAACLGHFWETPQQLFLWFLICNEREIHHKRITMFSPEKGYRGNSLPDNAKWANILCSLLSSIEYQGFYGFSSPMVIKLFYQTQLQLWTALCPETKWKRSCVLSKVTE